LIKTSRENLTKYFQVPVPDDLDWEERILPHAFSPVLTNTGWQMMKFSLLPSWSKEGRVKFATHNARLETIDSKPTWKVPFLKNHCLVPISGFIEPAYSGPLAGNLIQFREAAPGESGLMMAAGIYDHWVSHVTGEVIDSFAIITHDPSSYVSKMGHDREPLFLEPQHFDFWLKTTGIKAADLVHELRARTWTPKYTAEVDRALKPGWEKRHVSSPPLPRSRS
jgi:putative SOS response-associated peptidase YedK